MICLLILHVVEHGYMVSAKPVMMLGAVQTTIETQFVNIICWSETVGDTTWVTYKCVSVLSRDSGTSWLPLSFLWTGTIALISCRKITAQILFQSTSVVTSVSCYVDTLANACLQMYLTADFHFWWLLYGCEAVHRAHWAYRKLVRSSCVVYPAFNLVYFCQASV